jgi:hypothetical protein
VSERIEPEDISTHDVEIEADILRPGRHRASCSCGFTGPARTTRAQARADRDAHQDRRAEGKA